MLFVKPPFDTAAMELARRNRLIAEYAALRATAEREESQGCKYPTTARVQAEKLREILSKRT